MIARGNKRDGDGAPSEARAKTSPSTRPPPLPSLTPHSREWPANHDPKDRRVALRIRSWELRTLPSDDPRFELFSPRGSLHLQLWEPEANVSVLTPCQQTRGRLEVFPILGRRVRLSSYWQLKALLGEHFGITPPAPPVLAAAIRWFVQREEEQLVRRSLTPEPFTLSPSRSEIEGLSGSSIIPVEGVAPAEVATATTIPWEVVRDERN